MMSFRLGASLAPYAPETDDDPVARDDYGDGETRERVEELYRRHSLKLVRKLTRATGCGELARDLMHETFVRLLRMNAVGLAGIDQPEAFIHRVSVNLLRNWGQSRSLAERAQRALEIVADGTLDQLSILESRETLRRLELAMEKLKPKTRDIFRAHRIEGLSYAEIAVRYGMSVKGVEKQMSKAIARIHQMLDRG